MKVKEKKKWGGVAEENGKIASGVCVCEQLEESRQPEGKV